MLEQAGGGCYDRELPYGMNFKGAAIVFLKEGGSTGLEVPTETKENIYPTRYIDRIEEKKYHLWGSYRGCSHHRGTSF